MLLQPVELRQFRPRTKRRVHRHRHVELRIVNLVALPLLIVAHDRLEPVPPEDLRADETRPRLHRLPRALDRPLEDDDDLEPVLQHVTGGHVVQRRFLVDAMHDGHGPDEEQVAIAAVRGHGQLGGVLVEQFALFCLLGPDEVGLDAGADDVGLPHVPHAEHEAEVAVALAHHRVLGEEQRLRALAGPRHLREDDPPEVRLDHHPDDALEADEEDRLGTLLGDDPPAVADRVLRLDAVQEAAGEVVDVEHAGGPVSVLLERREMVRLQVAVREEDQPPDDGEAQPGEEEAGGEDQEGPSPLGVHQSREDVLQEADAAPRTLRLQDVAVAIFEDGPSADFPDGARTERFPETKQISKFDRFLRSVSTSTGWRLCWVAASSWVRRAFCRELRFGRMGRGR